MLEFVVRRYRPVGQFSDSRRPNERAPLGELLTQLLDIVQLGRSAGNRPRREAFSDRAGFPQRMLFRARQAIELLVQHLLERRRHAWFDSIDRHGQPPLLVVLRDDSAGHQVTDERRHEEWIPARVSMDGAGKIGRETGAAELQREVLGYFGGLELLQRNLAAQLANRKVLPQTADRGLRRSGWSTKGADEEHLRATLTPTERRDKVQRREIRPMEVFENEDECVVGGNGFECVTDFANHALASHADRVTLERRALLGLHERRKLEQPCRRPCRQRADETPVVRRPKQLIDGFEDRIVRFLAAESLDALTARDPQIRQQTGPLNEQVDEGGLPDASLPAHEDDLPLASHRAFEMAVESGAGRLSIHERFRRGERLAGRDWAIVGHRCDELVPTLRKGSNELRIVMPVAENLPDSQDVLLDDFMVDEAVGPQRFEDLFLCNEP